MVPKWSWSITFTDRFLDSSQLARGFNCSLAFEFVLKNIRTVTKSVTPKWTAPQCIFTLILIHWLNVYLFQLVDQHQSSISYTSLYDWINCTNTLEVVWRKFSFQPSLSQMSVWSWVTFYIKFVSLWLSVITSLVLCTVVISACASGIYIFSRDRQKNAFKLLSLLLQH